MRLTTLCIKGRPQYTPPQPLRAPASQSSHPPLLMFYQAAFATLAERRETEKQRISEKVQSIPANRNA